MSISSIAGASQLMKTAETQQAMSTTMVKKAAEAQEQIANMLAQNSKQAAQQPAKNPDYGFSVQA